MLGTAVSGLAETVGRERELEAVRAFLSGPAPSALVLEGELGIGKTTLWRAGIETALEGGQRVLSCRAVQAEAQLSFIGLGDLLSRLPDAAIESLPVPQRRGLEIALLRTEPDLPQLDPRAVDLAFLNILRALSLVEPVVLAIDDLQWLDAATLGTVSFALRRLVAERVYVLASFRFDGTERAQPLPLDRIVRVPVGPLSLGAIHRILSVRLGLTVPRAVLRRIEFTSEGNPFFALELGRALQRLGEPEAGHELPVPENLQELVAERLADLPDASIELLLHASALANPTAELLEAALGDAAALEPALAAGLVGREGARIHFSHPLLASTLYARASPEQRASAHRRLAAVVQDPEQRARHLALAADAPDATTAAALEEAARRARARGATVAAAELYEQAQRLTPEAGGEAWARRGTEAAAAYAAGGDWSRAHSLCAEVIENAPAGPTRAEALLRLADMRPGSFAECEQALAEAGEDTRLRASAHSRLAWQSAHACDFDAMKRHAYTAVQLAEATTDRPLLGRALFHVAMAEVLTGGERAAEQLQRAERIEAEVGGADSVYMSSRNLRALSFHWADQIEPARSLFEEHLRQARDLGDETSQAQLLLGLTEVEWRAGNWELAHDNARAGYELCELAGYDHGRSGLRAGLALIDAHQGALDIARERIAAGLAISAAIGDRVFPLNHLSVLLFIELSLGDYPAAVSVLETLRAELPAEDPGPAWTYFHADEIEVLIGAGRLEPAAARLAQLERIALERRNPRLTGWAMRSRGLLLAAQGDRSGARASLELALEDAGPQPFERARTLLALGTVQRGAKQWKAAGASLTAALELFERLGAPLWALKAEAGLGRLGGRPKGEGVLTASEQRVAELVAEGRSNKEVAAELSIAVHTVELHLSHAYAKLGVRSRLELARRLR